MSLVLDTHIWLWWLLGQADLSQPEREALDIQAATDPPVLPAVCMWEAQAQMLHAKRRLALNVSFSRWLVEATQPAVVRVAPLTVEVVLEVDTLPRSFHGDPADPSDRCHCTRAQTPARYSRRPGSPLARRSVVASLIACCDAGCTP